MTFRCLETLWFLKSRLLTGEALFEQKCNPNHNQVGRPQHYLAHAPHAAFFILYGFGLILLHVEHVEQYQGTTLFRSNGLGVPCQFLSKQNLSLRYHRARFPSRRSRARPTVLWNADCRSETNDEGCAVTWVWDEISCSSRPKRFWMSEQALLPDRQRRRLTAPFRRQICS